jgi:hypothetical protein
VHSEVVLCTVHTVCSRCHEHSVHTLISLSTLCTLCTLCTLHLKLDTVCTNSKLKITIVHISQKLLQGHMGSNPVWSILLLKHFMFPSHGFEPREAPAGDEVGSGNLESGN